MNRETGEGGACVGRDAIGTSKEGRKDKVMFGIFGQGIFPVRVWENHKGLGWRRTELKGKLKAWL